MRGLSGEIGRWAGCLWYKGGGGYWFECMIGGIVIVGPVYSCPVRLAGETVVTAWVIAIFAGAIADRAAVTEQTSSVSAAGYRH